MSAAATSGALESASARSPSALPRWLGPLLVAAVTVVALLPFLNRAFHIDDPVFLLVAEQILKDPLHPYDFVYNWDLQPRPMWQTTQHPPLHSYLLAGVGLLADMREWNLHLGYLGLAVGCSLLMHSIARRLCARPTLATLLSVASPAFLVSACSLMADIPLLFFWLLAIRAALAYADTNRPRWLWLACLAATAATMTKYFGVALVPLLLVHGVARRRSPGHAVRLVFALSWPVLALLAWGAYAKEQSGMFHPFNAASNSLVMKMTFLGVFRTLAHTLSYSGATLFWPILLIPFALRLRWWQIATVLLLAAAALTIEWRAELNEPVSVGIDAATLVTFTVAAGAGGLLLVVCASSWFEKIDSESSLLGLWFFGTIAFVGFCNWTVNARVILPCVLPAAILTVRWLERLEPAKLWNWWMPAAVVPTLAVALWVAQIDARHAEVNRTFAQTTVRELIAGGNRVLFSGHWGFQLYLEREGAIAINHTGQLVKPGDYVVYPEFNCYLERLRVPVTKVDDIQFPNPYLIHTTNPTARASFYASGNACLPFYFCGGCPADRFTIHQVVEPQGATEAAGR